VTIADRLDALRAGLARTREGSKRRARLQAEIAAVLKERNAIVQQWRYLPTRVAMQYASIVGRDQVDDLIQAGCVGLIRGVEKHDPALGTLTTCAYQWVRQSMQRFMETAFNVRFPSHAFTDVYKPHLREQAMHVRRKLMQIPVNEEGVEMDLPERKQEVPAVSAEERTLVQRCMRHLHPVDKYVLQRRLNNATLQELADELGVSKERVRQREKRAIRRMRKLVLA
jgi:RNA polymerase sigma factor (sigma-70 family)